MIPSSYALAANDLFACLVLLEIVSLMLNTKHFLLNNIKRQVILRTKRSLTSRRKMTLHKLPEPLNNDVIDTLIGSK